MELSVIAGHRLFSFGKTPVFPKLVLPLPERKREGNPNTEKMEKSNFDRQKKAGHLALPGAKRYNKTQEEARRYPLPAGPEQPRRTEPARERMAWYAASEK